jgi:hypothetical protein
MTPALTIVALAADQPLSPRGERARAVAAAGRRVADIQLIGPGRSDDLRRRARRLTRLASPYLLDHWEPEAWWALRARRARPDAGLLIGFPFSGVYWGARRLVAERVPYVVDLGDPWTLTLPRGQRPPMGGLRSGRCEEFVWRHASGAILTTAPQANALRRLFPGLPVAVRPNGYRATAPAPSARRDEDAGTLRLVHYGSLYAPRLDIAPLLLALAACGRWDSVVLTQQGDDRTGTLSALPATIQVELCRPRGWDEVVASASEHDLAVVLGNRNSAQLPSKAVQYLTLPIPRLAIIGGDPADALHAYVHDKPGWLTLPYNADADSAGAAVAAHLASPWDRDRLAPPRAESWETVADEIVDFTLACAGSDGGAGVVRQRRSRAMAAASSSHPR